MAIVSGRSDLIKNYLDDTSRAPDEHQVRGRRFYATGTVLNVGTDSSGSKYQLAELPSDCILDDDTAFDVQNWGFAQVVIGTETDTTALVNVAKAAGNTHRPIVFGDAAHGVALWQKLGLAADPGGNIAIWAHAVAGATGAGDMPFQFSYRYR